jgi:polyhydroxybutyrate depolymerase
MLALGLASCRPTAHMGSPAPQPTPSGSCGLAASGRLSVRTLTVGGQGVAARSRTVQVYLPLGETAGSRLPLLISLHGLGATGTIQGAITGWTRFDDRQAAAGAPFVAAFPDGLTTLWFWGLDSSYDVAFLYDVAADLVATGCVDPARVYVDGWSEGAYMAQRMACAAGDPAVATHGIRLAGVSSYAGGDPILDCHPDHATALLLSQGESDTLISPTAIGFPAYQAWARRYGCVLPTQPWTTPQAASGCQNQAHLAWWPLAGLGHLQWSCPADPLWHNTGIWTFLTTGIPPLRATCP